MTTHSGCGCNSTQAKPTDVLRSEHRVIERVLDAMQQLAANTPIDAAAFRDAIDFLRNFADGCHHAKEENELFPRLEVQGIPRDGGPIGCMLDEHVRGRALIRAMSASLDGAAAGAPQSLGDFRRSVADYVDLLRKHIWKEDNVLFAMADQVLGAVDRSALQAGFERTEAIPANVGKHEHYIALADSLQRRAFGSQPPAVAAAAVGSAQP